MAAGTIGPDHHAAVTYYRNDPCRFCGALPIAQLKKAHIRTWIDSHTNRPASVL
jgi:hypothetical protein